MPGRAPVLCAAFPADGAGGLHTGRRATGIRGFGRGRRMRAPGKWRRQGGRRRMEISMRRLPRRALVWGAQKRSLQFKCTGIKLVVFALLRQQLLVAAAFNDAAVFQDHNGV